MAEGKRKTEDMIERPRKTAEQQNRRSLSWIREKTSKGRVAIDGVFVCEILPSQNILRKQQNSRIVEHQNRRRSS
jgi:hypothetical protein